MPVFRDYHRTVVGYHGTRRRTALRIVTGRQRFSPSRSADDWLGHGVYFWEYGPKQAWSWARRRYPGDAIAVLGSMVRLGNCLDLLDPDNANELIRVHRMLQQDARRIGISLPKNRNARKYLDCQVLEYAYAAFESAQGEVIDSARAVYVPTQAKKRLWERSWLYHETHVQLTVRSPDCILGTWLVDPLEE